MCFSSTDRKKYICTRCLDNFNYEQPIHDHLPRCPNVVKTGNLVGQLRISGGYWKEQRRRRLESFIRQHDRIKQELDEMEKADLEENAQLEQDDENNDSMRENK